MKQEEYRESDPDGGSDDVGLGGSESTRKRSSRGVKCRPVEIVVRVNFDDFLLACDQCRKTKSKCERSTPDAERCKSCEANGLGESPTNLTSDMA